MCCALPSRAVPRDPEDRIMSWGRCASVLAGCRLPVCSLVHIQTPFLAHYAGLALARQRDVPVIATCHTYFEDYLHHYLPLLPRLASCVAGAFGDDQPAQCRGCGGVALGPGAAAIKRTYSWLDYCNISLRCCSNIEYNNKAFERTAD